MATKKTPAKSPAAAVAKTTKAPAAPAKAPAEKTTPAAAKTTPAAAKKTTPAASSAPSQSPLVVGAKAPDFKLADETGAVRTLRDFAGKTLVLYFYPKDDTPGCTRQACAFQENLGALAKAGVAVVGVSRDSAAAHLRFKTKYDLAFPLLVDADASLHRAYGAFGMKTLYGRTSEGALRTTVVIDGKGKVVRVFDKVKVDGHFDQVRAALP